MTVEDPLIGRILGGIRIRKLLGRGGMGAVYEGYQEMLERKLAVKVMNPDHAQNPIAPAYFLREARSASRLRHPNIIQIYDFGEENGLLYIAMEYIPGRPLDDIITDEFPLSAERIVHILVQLLSALEEAHANHIIHRDIKPENLMIEYARDGRDIVKVLDFGIAKPTEEASNLTNKGAVMGTPQYMSPEQACGKPLDGRSDLFSVGVMLYEMLTEMPPFYDKVLANLLIKLIQQEPASPSAARPDLVIHPGLEAVCLRALRKNVDQRYQTAAEFQQALEETLATGATSAPANAPKMFVFKRNADGSSGKIASLKARASNSAASERTVLEEPAPQRPTSERPPSAHHTSQGTGSYVDKLNRAGFSTPVGINTRQGQGPMPKSVAYDFDISDLKEDLLGQQMMGTVLCVHQRANQRIDLEAQKALREVVAREMEANAAEFGGIVHTRRGHCIPMLFGVNSTQDDHHLSAVEAALSLRDRLRRATPEHIVFGFALCFGALHQPSDGNLTQISGVPIDQAVDQAQAVDDELIVVHGQELGQKLGQLYELAPSKDDTATLVGIQAADYVLRNEKDFFGREADLARLLGVLASLSRGEGGSFVLCGETGMGKTALLGELAKFARQRGYHVVAARHRRPGAEGLRDTLRQWIVDLGAEPLIAEYEILTRWSSGGRKTSFASGSREALVGSEFGADEAIEAAFREFIGILSKERPLVLVVDQIVAYDEGVARFIAEWNAFCRERSVLFVAAIQTSPPRTALALPEGVDVLNISPLGMETSIQILRHKLKLQVEAPVIERLFEMAGGIPAYLHQLSDLLLARLAARENKDETLTLEQLEPWFGTVNTLGGTLHARLYAQPTNVRNVLALLSVLGSGSRAQWVDELGSKSWRVDEALQKLYDEDLIEVRGADARLYFDPLLLERIVYEELPLVQRQRIHARAAQYIDEKLQKTSDPLLIREYLVELVRHFEGCGQYIRALEAAHSLAIDSLASFEYRPARQHFRKILELIAQIPELAASRRGELSLHLGRIERTLGDTRRAVTLATEVYRDKTLPQWLRNEAALDLAEFWLDQEDTSMVENLVRRALADIRANLSGPEVHEGGDWLLSRGLKVLGDVLERQGKLGQAGDVLLEAVTLNGQRALDEADTPWRIRLLWEPLNQLGRLQLKLGRGEGAQKFFERALDLAARLGDVHGEIAARANLASMHGMLNQTARAFETLSEALALARRVGDYRALSRLQYNLGLLYVSQSRWNEAQSCFTTSREAALSLGWGEGVALNQEELRKVRLALSATV